MKKDEPIILIDSPEAAELKTVTGWVSRHGRYYGGDERLARWDGCTHVRCSTEGCDNTQPKTYTECEKCRSRRSRDKYEKMPFKEWDGELWVYSETLDEYFNDASSLEEKIEELVEDGEIDGPYDLRLIICEPNYPYQINYDDIVSDILPEDQGGEDVLSADINAALKTLNELLAKSDPISYSAGKFRTEYKPKTN